MSKRPTLAVLQPRRDKPQPEHAWCLEHRLEGFDVTILTEIGRPVDEARNTLTARVLSLDPQPDYVLWCDDDSHWLPGTARDFADVLDSLPELSLIGAPYSPTAYTRTILSYFSYNANGMDRVHLGVDIPAERPLEIHTTGSHFLMMRPALLRALPVNPWTLMTDALRNVDPDPKRDLEALMRCRLTEDHSFMQRVHDVGGSVFLYPQIKVAHVAHGYAFVPGAVYRFLNGDPSMPYPVRNPEGISFHDGDNSYGFGFESLLNLWDARVESAKWRLAHVESAVKA